MFILCKMIPTEVHFEMTPQWLYKRSLPVATDSFGGQDVAICNQKILNSQIIILSFLYLSKPGEVKCTIRFSNKSFQKWK